MHQSKRSMVYYCSSLVKCLRLKNSISKLLLVLCFLFFGMSGTVIAQAIPVETDSLYLLRANQKAMQLMYAAKPDESIKLLNEIIQRKENSQSYYVLAHIYNSEENWNEAIKNAEKAAQLDPNFGSVQVELFTAYAGAQRWKDALDLSEKARKGDVTNAVANQIPMVENAIAYEDISHMLFPVFFIILVCVFLIPVFRASKDNTNYFKTVGYRFSEVLLLSIAISCALRFVFYLLSPWIWAQNPHINTFDYAPPRYVFIYERDGIESFSMYVLMFLNVFLTVVILPWILRLKGNRNIYLVVFSALLLVSGYYLHSIGFLPPMPDHVRDGESHYLLIMIFLAIISIGLYRLYLFNRLAAMCALGVMVTFVGAVSLFHTSVVDLSYIVAPALRLYHGFGVNDIYFQYDLYLSLIALAIMKLHIDLAWFPYVAQFSFFLLFLGALLFSDKFFKSKGLSVFFIIALMLVRFYAISDPGYMIFQITPARLDLWIIPLFIAFSKGVRHWLVGLSLFLLIIFHRNLGVIYSISYLELLALLLVLEVITLVQQKKLNSASIIALLKVHLRSAIVNVLFVTGAMVLCYVLFGGVFSKSALLYTSLGIGMLPVSPVSFYWYMPVILSSLAVFLIYNRGKLGDKYVSIGLFIILLTIGNSMYFFGRSHEHAILCLSAILSLSFFVLLDVLIFTAPAESEIIVAAKATPVTKGKQAKPEPQKKTVLTQKKILTYLPIVFILFVGYFYSERILEKVQTQYSNLKESQYIFPLQPLLPPFDSVTIKKVTNNSRKVFFLDPLSFYFYYYTGYVPQGYFNPTATYVYKKDLAQKMQSLLDQGYYIVYHETRVAYYTEYFPLLNYNHTESVNGYIALSLVPLKPILPEDKSTVLHVAIADTLIKDGMTRDFPANIGSEFTIETLIMPTGMQVPNASIINNLTQFPYDGLRGIGLQLDNAIQGQYLVAASNGTVTTPNVVFKLDNNVWHYITATINKQDLKVYDNGKLIGTSGFNGQPFVNSDMSLTIGNRSTHDCKFNGYIRDIRITNGNPDEAEIQRRAQQVAAGISSGAIKAGAN